MALWVAVGGFDSQTEAVPNGGQTYGGLIWDGISEKRLCVSAAEMAIPPSLPASALLPVLDKYNAVL